MLREVASVEFIASLNGAVASGAMVWYPDLQLED
jgi:hypothetical protein